MPKLKLRGKDLRRLGFEDNRHISLAINLAKAHCRHQSKPKVLLQLKQVRARPEDFREDPVWGPLALALLGEEGPATTSETAAEGAGEDVSLAGQKRDFPVFGTDIEPGAMQQMETAMQLPVTVAGALMPDAHQGYGLPIGGVLATDNAVIPFGVGVDIGCRMALSVFPIRPEELHEKRNDFKRLLLVHTRFGREEFSHPMDDEVLERPEFREFPLLRKLHKKAARQIGTSGSGNHFVEWGIVEIADPDNELGLEPGTWVALLSHSGSRHLGAAIANHYTKVAMAKRRLPKHARHLAWLRLDEPEGMEYWKLMNLA
ncbi:MAG: RtcB family protein, partial [Bacteroidetes bacterium]